MSTTSGSRWSHLKNIRMYTKIRKLDETCLQKPLKMPERRQFVLETAYLCISGPASSFAESLPYYDKVSRDPTIREMRDVVVTQGIRPYESAHWKDNDVSDGQCTVHGTQPD